MSMPNGDDDEDMLMNMQDQELDENMIDNIQWLRYIIIE